MKRDYNSGLVPTQHIGIQKIVDRGIKNVLSFRKSRNLNELRAKQNKKEK